MIASMAARGDLLLNGIELVKAFIQVGEG